MTQMDKNPKTLYVSDMDGTLLNSQSVLSGYTVSHLNTLINDKGILFTVATARTPATVVPLMQDVKSRTPYVVMTGAALWHADEERFSDVRVLDENVLGDILEVFDAHHVNPFLYRRHGNQIVVYHTKAATKEELDFITPRVKTKRKRLVLVDRLDANDDDEALLVFSLGKYEVMNSVNNAIRERRLPCSPACYYDIATPDNGILDIYGPNTTKALAIKSLASSVGADRIVVFGDNRNDIPMMEMADYSVAVSNAYDEVKAVADEVIGSNDDDSVVRWIEKDINSF